MKNVKSHLYTVDTGAVSGPSIRRGATVETCHPKSEIIKHEPVVEADRSVQMMHGDTGEVASACPRLTHSKALDAVGGHGVTGRPAKLVMA